MTGTQATTASWWARRRRRFRLPGWLTGGRLRALAEIIGWENSEDTADEPGDTEDDAAFAESVTENRISWGILGGLALGLAAMVLRTLASVS